jgi:hypothetical protein
MRTGEHAVIVSSKIHDLVVKTFLDKSRIRPPEDDRVFGSKAILNAGIEQHQVENTALQQVVAMDLQKTVERLTRDDVEMPFASPLDRGRALAQSRKRPHHGSGAAT